jgi:hypothetical protein
MMTRYSNITIELPQSAGLLSGWLPVAGHLCDALIGHWTVRQAELMRAAVDPKEPGAEEIGQSLKPAVSKQAVSKGLSGANWYVIREAVHLFEETAWGTALEPAALDNRKCLSTARQPKRVV